MEQSGGPMQELLKGVDCDETDDCEEQLFSMALQNGLITADDLQDMAERVAPPAVSLMAGGCGVMPPKKIACDGPTGVPSIAASGS